MGNTSCQRIERSKLLLLSPTNDEVRCLRVAAPGAAAIATADSGREATLRLAMYSKLSRTLV